MHLLPKSHGIILTVKSMDGDIDISKVSRPLRTGSATFFDIFEQLFPHDMLLQI